MQNLFLSEVLAALTDVNPDFININEVHLLEQKCNLPMEKFRDTFEAFNLTFHFT
jgi:pyruvate formate-lyase activating enzyme-like uncharacterized protein